MTTHPLLSSLTRFVAPTVTASLAFAAGTTVAASDSADGVAPVRDVPVVVDAVSGTTSGNRLTLPEWAPAADDALLVSVVTQSWRKIDVNVSAPGVQFVPVDDVVSAQNVLRVSTFMAHGQIDPGSVTVGLPRNKGAASVIALAVSGTDLTEGGKAALAHVTSNAGPADVDTSDMLIDAASEASNLVVGFGGNRLRDAVVPDGQEGYAVNVAEGGGGGRLALSAFGVAADGESTRVGGVGSLTGGSGVDDWAMTAVALRGAVSDCAAGVQPSPSPSPTATAEPTATPTSEPSPSPTATVEPSPTPSPSQSPSPEPSQSTAPSSPWPDLIGGVNSRAYADDSPWNTPIAPEAKEHPSSNLWIERLASGPSISSDVSQYTFTVYEADASTPRRDVDVRGYFSRYSDDNTRLSDGFNPVARDVPIPDDAVPSPGSDGSIIIIDTETGEEYAFWQFARAQDGSLSATNGYKYHTALQGRFDDGLAGRGAGTTYLGGLVHDWEIAEGEVNHALAFGYKWPSKKFVYPASKSDGLGDPILDLPEGARLQLDPNLTETDFDAWGLSEAGKVMARALQTYGMYVVDNSGSPKVYVEDEATAKWNGEVNRNTLSAIPWSAFRVVE